MKLATAICEYNPLHNGHINHLTYCKDNGEAVAIIMSGNFCQRGDMAIVDKYTRAEQAILAGADIVFELPTVFAISPAEVFAKGGVNLLSQLNGEKLLVFGSEIGTKQEYIDLAKVMLFEDKEFKNKLKAYLDEGLPFAEARCKAIEDTHSELNIDLLKNPNSILGLEYVKALRGKLNFDFLPINRENNYLSKELKGKVCSALAIRESITNKKLTKVKNFVPKYVYKSLPESLNDVGDLCLYALKKSSSKELSQILDCTEGLENRIKALAKNGTNYQDLLDKLETKRYTRTRLKRIILANMLGVTSDIVKKALQSQLYLKVLAINQDKMYLLSELKGDVTFVTRKADADKLTGINKTCFDIDTFSNEIFNMLSGTKSNEFEMRIVKR